MQTCAFSKKDGSVVIVVLNPKGRDRKASLPKGYELVNASYTDSSHDVAKFDFEGKLPAKSVVTFVLKKS